MPPKSATTTLHEDQRLLEVVIRLDQIASVVNKLNESIEGTTRTKGLKEKITIAEYNIDANKQAFREMQDELKKIEEKFGKTVALAVSDLQGKIFDKFEFMSDKMQETNDVIKILREAGEHQKSFVDKFKPLLSALSWLITGAGSIILTMFLTGKLNISLSP